MHFCTEPWVQFFFFGLLHWSCTRKGHFKASMDKRNSYRIRKLFNCTCEYCIKTYSITLNPPAALRGSSEASYYHIIWSCPSRRFIKFCKNTSGRNVSAADRKAVSRDCLKQIMPPTDDWIDLIYNILMTERTTFLLKLQWDQTVIIWENWMLYIKPVSPSFVLMWIPLGVFWRKFSIIIIILPNFIMHFNLYTCIFILFHEFISWLLSFDTSFVHAIGISYVKRE